MSYKEIKIEPEKTIKVSRKHRTKKIKNNTESNITHHETWVKKNINPILRKLFGIEIFSAVSDDKVVGYGIRKQLK
jgi:hypothetical protein